MIGTILFVLAVVSIAVVIALGVLLAWALGENRTEDPSRPLIGVFRNWVRRRPARLDYRRDKKGRFRKIRRG